MSRMVFAAVLAVASAAAADPAHLTIGPLVQAVGPDHFTVIFETDQPTTAAVRVGSIDVATALGTHHEAVVTHLAPETRQRYSVLLDGQPVDGGEVLTAPPDGAARPVTFLVYGDNRDARPEVTTGLVNAMSKEGASFALHSGDMVATGADDTKWRAFFDGEKALLRNLPVFPVAGNHELHNDPGATHLLRYYAAPEPFRTHRWYAFRWGDMVFIALDGNQLVEEQTKFLETELARAKGARHVFVFMHQPPLSTGHHCGAGAYQAAWVQLFETHHVRAVFAGHDHAYERLERGGIRYFISGGGGAPIYEERMDCNAADHSARRAYSAEHHYLRIRVTGDEVDVAVQRLGSDDPPIETVRWQANAPAPVTAIAAPDLENPPPRKPVRFWPIPVVVAFVAALLVFAFSRRRRRK